MIFRTRFLVAILAAAMLAVGCAADDAFVGPADGSSSFPIEIDSRDFVVEDWSSVAVTATSIEFLPGGSALVLTKGGWSGPGVGEVKLFAPDGDYIWDVGSIPVCTDAERGLLGVAVDPGYLENRYIYLYYTRQMNDCALNEPDTAPVWNRISRFTLNDDGIDMASEFVLVDEIPGHQSSHNAGDLEFAPDGMLLASTGEATRQGQHDPMQLNAKILRIDPHADDLVPLDNPYADQPFPANIVFAAGLRNPYRIAVDPTDGTIVAADVGGDEYEELNVITAGADYGWPETEGPDVQEGSVAPAGWYRHLDGCAGAVIGGDFVAEDLVPRPPGRSVYVYSDMLCQNVVAVEMLDGVVERAREIATVGHQLGDVKVGPDGALYLIPIGPGEFLVQRLSRG